MSLSHRLKVATKECHHRAERCDFMQKIFSGQLSVQSYANYLSMLLPVYQSIRTGIESLQEKDLFKMSLLDRCQSLQQDINRICGLFNIEPHIVCNDYADYLYALEDKTRFVAHYYARYLGDLNGGQVLMRMLSVRLGMPSDCLNFYVFPLSNESLKALSSSLKSAIDQVVLSVSQKEIEEEAQMAFEFNIKLMKQACKRNK